MAEVSLKHVSKRYGAAQVVHDASLSIGHGEFVVFVGPSGCGKSTLLRMIAGLEDISGGDVSIDGQRVNAVPARDRGVAMVFQNYALYPHMTVAANMSFGLENVGTPRSEIDARVRQAAEILQITKLLDRKPKNMSGGQRQRVAIGRAIVRKRKVFLFDEPLSNLDAALRVQMRIELARLHQSLNATMIYVTHDQTDAMTMADRIVVLRDSRIEQVGAPLDLYRRPRNVFVAGFLGLGEDEPHRRHGAPGREPPRRGGVRRRDDGGGRGRAGLAEGRRQRDPRDPAGTPVGVRRRRRPQRNGRRS